MSLTAGIDLEKLRQAESGLRICPACVQLAAELSAVISAGYQGEYIARPIRHHRPFAEIQAYARENLDCPMCQLLQPEFSDEGVYEPTKNWRVHPSAEVEVIPEWRAGYESGKYEPRHLARLRYLYVTARKSFSGPSELETLLRAEVPGRRSKNVPDPLLIYAPMESQAPLGRNAWCRHRLSGGGSPEAMRLMSMWFSHCLSNHKDCHNSATREHKDGEEAPQLPKRVLDLTSETPGGSNVRLIESLGRRGRWAALSHCWGSPTMRPLQTTQANYQSHMEEIDFKSLSKTFRDAVTVARALKIPYLWIDSLCIIQDKRDDWVAESSRMGSIYQHAILTIAAAYAQDSSEGCFFEDPAISFNPHEYSGSGAAYKELQAPGDVPRILQAQESTAALPLFQGTEISSYLYISKLGRGVYRDTSTVVGQPLFKCGWVLQEWTLSRRSLIFFQYSIVWSCRELSEDERGNSLSLERRPVDHWQGLVRDYSGMNLTFESDRLAALEGMIRGRAWTAEMPDCLLWHANGSEKAKPAELREMDVPSWTWAKLKSAVGFQLDGRPRVRSRVDQPCLTDLTELLDVQASGVLRIKAPVALVAGSGLEFVRPRGSWSSWDAFLDTSFEGYSSWKQVNRDYYASHGHQLVKVPSSRRHRARYAYEDLVKDRHWAGWATLDLERTPGRTVVLLALKQEKEAVLRECGWAGRMVEDAYHVLLLCPVSWRPGRPRRLFRVGAGVVAAPSQKWKMETVEIV